MSPCLRGRSGSAIWADGGCGSRPARGGAVSVHNTCVYIRRQSLGSAIPVPIVPVQVESRQVYVSPWWEAGRAGQDWARDVSIMWNSE